MKIIDLQKEPIHTIIYKNVLPAAKQIHGESPMADKDWEVLKGTVEGMPENLDAMIFASDLQGHTQQGEKLILLGETMPEELLLLLEIDYPEIDPKKVGVVLCGDLFALAHKRGGHGDVREVWRAFRDQFAWVVGVAGNHDRIGDENEKIAEFKFEEGIHFLEKGKKKIAGMTVAGVSGVIGSYWKEFRWEEADFLGAIRTCLNKKPDLFLLHEGPDFPGNGFRGNVEVREILEQKKNPLICFGHEYWPEALKELENGTQLLNLEGRTVILFPSN